MLTEFEDARALEERQRMEEAAENRRVIEEQAYLRFVKYGMLPEGNYEWYPAPKGQNVGRTHLRG